jgi:hypothetical protein
MDRTLRLVERMDTLRLVKTIFCLKDVFHLVRMLLTGNRNEETQSWFGPYTIQKNMGPNTTAPIAVVITTLTRFTNSFVNRFME